MERKYSRKDLYLAELKYYDEEHNGVEFGEELSLVVLSSFKKGDETIYYNVLNEGEVLPTFGRSMEYGQYDENGEQYGTMMRHLGGKLQTGPCWVLRHNLDNYDLEEPVTREAIEDAVLNSEYYFKDRKEIAERKRKEKGNFFKMIKILRRDSADEEYMNFFFQQREEERQKTKK